MCVRHGSSDLTSIKTIDFSRRHILRGATATTIAIAVSGSVGDALAQGAKTSLKGTKGAGF